ncbi:hypothetical protein A9Q84_20460 [Halobacteriovorax marinus]|uniref:Nucleotidyl transferase domain-containing protein n=1 Tax=Halobacteriovorax marinus TaxID=97084 RepID=A0A1Y5F184_9BACT|nr:hypothetical protein A9Q84_20460 [Halobacteriovorax marinus]
MKVENAFILGAGLGTRMGEVGKVLPKLLWPVFEKSLLELQVDFAKSLGVQNIYINTHFHAEQIHKYISEKKLNINVLHEESLLDIGGGIHNLAKLLSYKGKVLILNGDQFLFQEISHYERLINLSDNYTATLLGLKVSHDSGYNELILENNQLIEITKHDSKEDYFTYSGSSIINLSKLIPVSGESKFFDSVAKYKDQSVYVYNHDELEYWDFGTAERYFESMRKVFSLKQSHLYNFLINSNAITVSKVGKNSTYNCTGTPYSINLTNEENPGFGNIVIEGKDDSTFKKCIVFNEIKTQI